MPPGGMRQRAVEQAECPCGESHAILLRIAGWPVIVCDKGFTADLPTLHLKLDAEDPNKTVLVATTPRTAVRKLKAT